MLSRSDRVPRNSCAVRSNRFTTSRWIKLIVHIHFFHSCGNDIVIPICTSGHNKNYNQLSPTTTLVQRKMSQKRKLSQGWNGSIHSFANEIDASTDSSDDDFMLSSLRKAPKSSKKRRSDALQLAHDPYTYNQATKKPAMEKAMSDKRSNSIADNVTMPNPKSITARQTSTNQTDVLASDLQRNVDLPKWQTSLWNVADDSDDIGSDPEEIALLKNLNLRICEAEEAELMEKLDNEILEAEFAALDKLTWERIKAAVTKYRGPGGRVSNVLYPMENMTPEQRSLDEDWAFHDAVQDCCFVADIQKKINEQSRKKRRGAFDVDNMGNPVVREITKELPKYIGTSQDLVFTDEDIKTSMVRWLCQGGRVGELLISLKDKEDDPYTVMLKIKADEPILERAKQFIENHIRTKQMRYLSLDTTRRAKSTIPTKVIGSRNLELYKRFVNKYEKIKDIDFGGIHAKSVISSMWQKHKARYGPACGPGCHCPFELDALTSTVIDDALKKLPNAERPREIGFSKWFAPKFMGLLRKEFPRDTNADLFHRLVRMWESHLKQQRFGTSCRETCPCLEGWGPVFKRGHLEESVVKSKTSSSGMGSAARCQEAPLADDRFSQRATPAQSSQKEYEIVFDTRRPLGFFCATQKGVCKILSVSPSVKDVRMSRGTIIVSVAMGRSSDWHPIRSHDELKTYYENFKRHIDGQWMRIRFINTDVKIETTHKRDNQWAANNAWRGNSNVQGWAGGATLVATNERKVVVATDDRAVESSSTGTYVESSSRPNSFRDECTPFLGGDEARSTITLNRVSKAPVFHSVVGSRDQSQIQSSGPSSKGTRSNQIGESRQPSHGDSIQQVEPLRPQPSVETRSRMIGERRQANYRASTQQEQSVGPPSPDETLGKPMEESRQANHRGLNQQIAGSASSNNIRTQQLGASRQANHRGSIEQITRPASSNDTRSQKLGDSCQENHRGTHHIQSTGPATSKSQHIGESGQTNYHGSIQQNHSTTPSPSIDTFGKQIGKSGEPNHRGSSQPRSIFKGASKFSKPQHSTQGQSMFRSLANVPKRSKPVLVRWAKEFESKVFDSHVDASKSLKGSTSTDTATQSGEHQQQIDLVAENGPSSSELLSAIAHKTCLDVFELLKAGAETRPKRVNQLEVPEAFAKSIRDSLVAKMKRSPTEETKTKYADIISKVNLLKIFDRARDVMANSACLKKWVRYEARIDRIEDLRLTSVTPQLPGDKFLCEIQIMGEVMGTAQQSKEWAESIEWPETKGARYKFYYNESLPDRYISGERTLVVTFRKTIGNSQRTIDLASQTRQLDEIKSAVTATDIATMEIEMKPTACLQSGRAVVVVRKLRDETMAKMNDKRDRYRRELKQLINDMKAFNADKRRETAGMPELDFNMRQPESPHITPLHAAVYLNDVQLVTELIACGADINAKSGKGISPRTLALMMNEVFSKDKDREKELNNSKKILELLGIHEDCEYAVGVDISTEDDEDEMESRLASPPEVGEDSLLVDKMSQEGTGVEMTSEADRVEIGSGNNTGSLGAASILKNLPRQDELTPHSEQKDESKGKTSKGKTHPQRQLHNQVLSMDQDDLPKMTLQQRLSQGRPLCRYHNSPRGCKQGKWCNFMHVNPKKGSTSHIIPSYGHDNLKVATEVGEDHLLVDKVSQEGIGVEMTSEADRTEIGSGNSIGSLGAASILKNLPGQDELTSHSEQDDESKGKTHPQRQQHNPALSMDQDDLPKMTLQRLAQGRPLCRYHSSPRGCKQGKRCNFMHLDHVNPKKVSTSHIVPCYRHDNLKVATDMDSNGHSCFTALYRDVKANIYLKATGGKTLGANRDGVYWYQTHEDAIESIEHVIYLWRNPHLQSRCVEGFEPAK